VAQHVRDQWDAGSTKHPKDVAATLAGNSNLTKSQGYLSVYSTATGIQCCSHTEAQLESALHNVVNDPDAPADLKQEAQQALKQVKKYAGGPTNAIRTPYSLHENINPPSEENTARKQKEKTHQS